MHETLLVHRYVLDIDNTVKPIYGHQEGAELGYNPIKPGRPSHNYHLFFIGKARIALMRDEPPQRKPLNDRATALGPYYTSIVRQMSEAECWTSDSVQRQAVSAARLFFRWLEARKCRSLETVTPAIVRLYYIARASEVSTPKHLRFALKLVCEFLNRRGFIDADCSCVFALRPPSYSRLLPALGPDEIAKALDATDRRTAVGRRDYAVVLQGLHEARQPLRRRGKQTRDAHHRQGGKACKMRSQESSMKGRSTTALP